MADVSAEKGGREPTMEELMAELESEDGMDAFDRMLDKAASDVANAHSKSVSPSKRHEDAGVVLLGKGGSDDGYSGSSTSQPVILSMCSSPSTASPMVVSGEGRDEEEGGGTPSSSDAMQDTSSTSPQAPEADGEPSPRSNTPPRRPSEVTSSDAHVHSTQPPDAPWATAATSPASSLSGIPSTKAGQPGSGGGGNGVDAFSLGSFFASALGAATSVRVSADEMMWDRQKLNNTVNSLLSAAGEELYCTTYDLAAAARAGNSKILLRPQASFGVPLELIAGRECGDPEAEVCCQVVEGMIVIMEEHHQAHGRLSASLFTRWLSPADRDGLASLRDQIDSGVPLTRLDLGEDAVATAADLLRLFLLELPVPLLTHALYDGFLQASRVGRGELSDVAQRMPPPCRAAARRILSFLYTAVVQDAPDRRAMAERLAIAIGPCVLRSGSEGVMCLMRDVAEWRGAVSMCLEHAEDVFAHSCWFMGPWMGVYSIECVEVFASQEVAVGWAVEGGVGSVSELMVDAHGLSWGGHRSKPGSEVNASHWERNRDDEGYNPKMVLAAKFGLDTMVLSFDGDGPWEGIGTVEHIVIEPDSKGGGGLQERVLRRFEGRYMRPLLWESTLDAWNRGSVGVQWDDKKHNVMLQELWTLTFPEDDAPPKVHDDWQRLGFSREPRGDFGEAGLLALELLILMGENHNPKYKAALSRSQGASEEDSYPFARTAIRLLDELLRALKLMGDAARGEVGGSWGLRGKEVMACRRALGNLLLAPRSEDECGGVGDMFGAALWALDSEWVASRRTAACLGEVVARAVVRGMASLRVMRPPAPQT